MERDQVRIMEQLEKVEKLRERANVSYEDAKMALEKSNGDLLDAMVLLEQLGKVEAPNNTSYSTSYEEQPQYLSVPDTIKSQDTSSHDGFVKLKRLIKLLKILRSRQTSVLLMRQLKQQERVLLVKALRLLLTK